MNQMPMFDSLPACRPRPKSVGSIREPQARKLNGQFKATKRARSLWVLAAMAMLRSYLFTLKEAARMDVGNEMPLMNFDAFRTWAEGQGMARPASLNAWGGLPSAAVRAGLIAPTSSTSQALRDQSHGRLVRIWRVL